MKTVYWFGHKGKTISSNSFTKIKDMVKDHQLLSAVIYRDKGWFINNGNRPQNHYNYSPKY